jgi:hypothetical protein
MEQAASGGSKFPSLEASGRHLWRSFKAGKVLFPFLFPVHLTPFSVTQAVILLGVAYQILEMVSILWKTSRVILAASPTYQPPTTSWAFYALSGVLVLMASEIPAILVRADSFVVMEIT